MSDDFTLDASQIKEFQKDLDKFQKRSNSGLKKLTHKYALILQQRVRTNASGRPGPQQVTGDYVRSIQVDSDNVVYTDAAQARRLEFGFVGIDAMGRHYAQPPFPHWQPAFESTYPEFYDEVEQSIPGWWKG